MSFIEGVGDEVTGCASILLIACLIATYIFFNNNDSFPRIHTPVSPTPVVPEPQSPIDVLEDVPENLEDRPGAGEGTSDNTEDNVQNSNANENTETCVANSTGPDSCSENENKKDPDNIQNKQQNSSIYPDIQNGSLGGDTSVEGSVPSAPPLEQVPQPGEIQIRIKYLDDRMRTVFSNPSVKIGDFKRIHFPEDTANNKVIRLIYNGQLLRDTSTLQSYGINNNCVVHVHISQAQAPQNAQTTSQNSDLDLSHLLWPLLSVILLIFWVLYFKYPEFFSTLSVGILLLFTGTFVFFYSQLETR